MWYPAGTTSLRDALRSLLPQSGTSNDYAHQPGDEGVGEAFSTQPPSPLIPTPYGRGGPEFPSPHCPLSPEGAPSSPTPKTLGATSPRSPACLQVNPGKLPLSNYSKSLNFEFSIDAVAA
jgi:hypothetical protein